MNYSLRDASSNCLSHSKRRLKSLVKQPRLRKLYVTTRPDHLQSNKMFRVELYGHFAPQCYLPHLRHGQALMEIARKEVGEIALKPILSDMAESSDSEDDAIKTSDEGDKMENELDHHSPKASNGLNFK